MTYFTATSSDESVRYQAVSLSAAKAQASKYFRNSSINILDDSGETVATKGIDGKWVK